ncbi:MAG TPA: GntR family transcriptional regulator [Thermomicrobiales bacterium]
MTAPESDDPNTTAGAGPDAVVELLASVLARDDRTPLAERLVAALETAIQDGRLAPGSVLPREPDLARRLGLGRQTVGRALGELARRGLLVRRRGIGTFVAVPPVEQPLGHLSSFVHTLAVEGNPPSARLLGVRLTVDPDASRILTGQPDALVWEIGRLFYADGQPFAVEWIYLNPECGERLPGDRLADGVIDELLRESCGMVVDGGEEVLSLATVDRTEATLLGRPAGAPAFLIARTAYAGDRPVEVRRRLIRGDRARFRIRLGDTNLRIETDSAAPSA